MAIFVIREGDKEGAVQTFELPSGDIAVTCQIPVNDSVKTICSSFAGTTFNWTYKNWIVPRSCKDGLYEALTKRGMRTHKAEQNGIRCAERIRGTVLYDGEGQSYVNELRYPEHWRPGCVTSTKPSNLEPVS